MRLSLSIKKKEAKEKGRRENFGKKNERKREAETDKKSTSSNKWSNDHGGLTRAHTLFSA